MIRSIAPVLFFIGGISFAQNSQAGNEETLTISRGSIPEALLRPQRGEAPRYPFDTVIGALGQGEAPREGYLFARQTAAALVGGNMNAAGFAGVNRVLLESYLSALSVISPRTYRLGSGREEADGAVSFLVRFVGREQGITGELYVRLQEQPSEPPVAEGAPEAVEGTSPVEGTGEAEGAVEAARPPARRVWVFEELILDEPRSRESEDRETQHRFDFSPYERFF
ncbi:MAG: hypothetical protein LBK62_06175 [Treponema sp.]|nr:hypothetical protein [Treponema sp.]